MMNFNEHQNIRKNLRSTNHSVLICGQSPTHPGRSGYILRWRPHAHG